MPHVEAEFRTGERIVFAARDRAAVNVRVHGADGEPIGFTSIEMLLMALANCTLGVVRGHESLKDVPVTSARATLDAEMASAPSRVGSITVRVELEVDQAGDRLKQTLQRVAEACPVGNTLRLPPEIGVEVVVRESTPAPVPVGD